MTAHLALPALEPDPQRPATLSPAALGYLRETLGYRGLIVTDDLEMGAIVDQYGTAEAAMLAFQAGADLLLFRRNVAEQQRAHALLAQAVRSGEISQQRLDDSVRRVLQAKARRGVLGEGTRGWGQGAGQGGQRPDSRAQGATTATGGTSPPAGATPDRGSESGLAGADVAADVARRSLTLVKNDGALLPLKLPAGAPVCAVYPRAEALRTVEVVPERPPAGEPQTLGEALRAVHATTRAAPIGLRPADLEVREALACAREAHVVVLGSYNLHEYPAQAALARQIVALGKPVVVVALRLPYDLAQVDAATALLAAYSSRPASLRAVADTLVGRGPAPSGRLPVPVAPRWVFGFGLVEWSKPDVHAAW
jgi:beta-N-acetylhexosaminidase